MYLIIILLNKVLQHRFIWKGMKISKLLFAVLATAASFNVATAAEDETWNILSLDGGGIRGLITATVASYIEDYTYTYAREKYCIPERAKPKVSLSELFDMVAGTSTGSLLATTIVFPDKSEEPQYPGKNLWYADKAI